MNGTFVLEQHCTRLVGCACLLNSWRAVGERRTCRPIQARPLQSAQCRLGTSSLEAMADVATDSAQELSTASPFDTLPQELLFLLFSQFDYVALARASQICADWRELASRNSFWASLSRERFVCTPDDVSEQDLHWKRLFGRRHKIWTHYNLAKETGVAELDRVLHADLAANGRWRRGTNPALSV